jgi:hypothetical protein
MEERRNVNLLLYIQVEDARAALNLYKSVEEAWEEDLKKRRERAHTIPEKRASAKERFRAQ